MHLEFRTVDPSLVKECVVCKFREEIEKIDMYCTVVDHIKNMNYDKYKLCECWEMLLNQVGEDKKQPQAKCCQIIHQPSVCHLRDFNIAHFVVTVLLSWPYEVNNEEKRTLEYGTGHGVNMKSIMAKKLSTADGVVKEEMRNIRDRFAVSLGDHEGS